MKSLLYERIILLSSKSLRKWSIQILQNKITDEKSVWMKRIILKAQLSKIHEPLISSDDCVKITCAYMFVRALICSPTYIFFVQKINKSARKFKLKDIPLSCDIAFSSKYYHKKRNTNMSEY